MPCLSFLIAEDDPDLRPILTHVLADAFPSAHVSAYANGREALAEFDRTGSDLVVSNHDMPEMNGPTFVRALRERSASRPIVMVSAAPRRGATGPRRASAPSWTRIGSSRGCWRSSAGCWPPRAKASCTPEPRFHPLASRRGVYPWDPLPWSSSKSRPPRP